MPKLSRSRVRTPIVKPYPDDFTIDEARTAQAIIDEGNTYCLKARKRPEVRIGSCDREALEPASRVFGRAIFPSREKKIRCPPHLFPPDGRGHWRVEIDSEAAIRVMQRLDPLLTTRVRKKWQKVLENCR